MSQFFERNKKLLIVGAVATAVIAYYYFSSHKNESKDQPPKPSWNQKWKKFRENNALAPWENTYPNREIAYLSEFDSNNKTMNIFVPLCGASKDMIHIKNYFGKTKKIKLIGLEISSNAVEYFLHSKLKQKYIVENKENVQIYRSEDGVFEFYVESIFDENVQRLLFERIKDIGFIDVIFDRAALNCIDPKQRKEYLSFMNKILNDNGGKILLSTLRFDKMASKPEYINRSPYSFRKQDIYDCFKALTNNDKNKIKLLKSVKWSESEYEDEKSLGKRMGIDIEHDGFCDIWSIEKKKEIKYLTQLPIDWKS